MGEVEAKKPRGTAKSRALGLLAIRWRSKAELLRRLQVAGFDPSEVHRALDDLEAVGLIDDRRFADELVRHASDRKLIGDRAIRADLRRRGVPADTAEGALASAGPEGERAEALAARRAERLRDLPAEAAYRRLYGLLVRRGYGPDLAREAVSRALSAEPGAEGGCCNG